MFTATLADRVDALEGIDPASGLPVVVVTCVHGTWARGSRWPDLEKAVTETLGDSGRVAFRYFRWSGRNSVKARTTAAADLRRFLRDAMSRSPGARHLLLAHSHGANIVLHALDGEGQSEIRDAIAAIALLSPTFLDCTMVDDSTEAANKLMLAALAVVPLLVLAARYARLEFGLSPVAAFTVFAVVTTLWLALFIPRRVRHRAETLARQLALPRLDVPGLVVRGPRDEATAVLSAIGVLAMLSRRAWSWVLRIRPPIHRHTERNLRRARSSFDLASALSQAWVLVPLGIGGLVLLQDSAAAGQWIRFSAALPTAILFLTAAVGIVGATMLLLLLLPSLAFLLWPFGVFPTTAAALLSLTVEEAPTARWNVVHLVDEGASAPPAWQHSTYADPTSIAVVCAYLRDVVSCRPEPKPSGSDAQVSVSNAHL